MRGIAIIVPVYDEEQAIAGVLEQLLIVATSVRGRCEIVVVDDGSVDATAEVVEQCRGVMLLRHRENRGYGAALKTGIRHARHNLVCITQGARHAS